MHSIKFFRDKVEYVNMVREKAVKRYGSYEEYINSDHGRALERNLQMIEADALHRIEIFQKSQSSTFLIDSAHNTQLTTQDYLRHIEMSVKN